MAEIRKWSDAELKKLCEIVYNNLQKTSHNEGSSSLSQLRRICGKSECSCPNFTPYQNLSVLLRLQSGTDLLIDYSVGLSIINNYHTLGHEEYCQTALEQMLRHALTDPCTESRNHFLDQLWPYPGLRNFRIDLVEDFLHSDGKYIDQDIFNLFEKVQKKCAKPECIWEQDPRFERIVFWSYNSARIFFTVAKVLNNLLQRIVDKTEQNCASVDVGSQFVKMVRLKCTEHDKDFVCLYPNEYHSLVSLLDIKPDLFPKDPVNGASVTLSTVIGFLKQKLDTKTDQTLDLLSHFPEWSQYINR